MADYNYIAINGGSRTVYRNVDHLATQANGGNQVHVIFFDNHNEIIAIVNLAAGERIERMPRES